MSEDTFEDVQADVDDLRATLNDIGDDIDNAESCETATDCDLNISNAIRGALSLLKELRDLQARIPGRKRPRATR